MAALQKKGKMSKLLIYAIMAIIAVAAIATYSYFHASSAKIVHVSAPTSATISYAPKVFSVEGNEYAMYVAGQQGNGTAHIYIAQLPAMVMPLLYVKLALHSATKINAGSNYTNIEIRLNSILSNGINVTIIPISASLLIAPDASMIEYIYVQAGGRATGINIYANSTTSTTVSSTTTSTESTTTKPPANNTQTEIQSLLNKDKFYPLALNYTALYRDTSSCTLQLYNTTYVSYYGSTPTVTYTYQNVSKFAPYNMLMITTGQNGLYIVNFITLTRDSFYNNTSAIKITLNTTAGVLTNTTLGGVYEGLNYTTLENLYNKAIVIGGPCGVYVAH